MYIVLIVLAALLCLFSGTKCVKSALEEKYSPAVFFKGLATIGCIIIAAVASKHTQSSDFAFYVMLGLFFGLLGDELLAFRTVFTKRFELCYLSGSLAFLVGHVFYIIGLLKLSPKAWIIAIPVCILSLLLALRTTKGLDMGSLFIPSGVYAAVLCFMFGTAFGAVILSFSVGTLLFALGGLLFMLSDTLLCSEYFGKKKIPMRYSLLHILYWSAQLLIALSPLFVK